MSLWNKLRSGLDMAQVAITGIEVIADLVKSKKRPSIDTLELIGNVVDNVKDALSGKVDPAKVRAGLEAMRADIAKNNADIDQTIDDKFKD